MAIQHLPYNIDYSLNRFHYYENYWKICGLKLIEKRFTSGEINSILDYGCGRGEALDIYGKRGFQVLGTDADSECVKISSRHGSSVLLDTKDPVGQFGEKSFDAVVCYHVLEHVPTPIDTVRALSKIARKAVVIAVPNLQTLTHFFRRDMKLSSVNEGHLQSWDHPHLLNLTERHGNLKLIEWGFDATVLPVFNRFGLRVFGTRGLIYLESKIFTRLLPFHCISVLGIFRPTI
jgi:SAM-dependent methyltransferase